MPAAESIAVTVIAESGETVRLELADALGRTARATSVEITEGRSAASRLDVSSLPAGAYLLRAIGEHGVVGAVQIVVTR